MSIKMREYCEELNVEIEERIDSDKIAGVGGIGRLIIKSSSEGGYSGTEVDLLDVIDWVRENKPELLEKAEKPF